MPQFTEAQSGGDATRKGQGRKLPARQSADRPAVTVYIPCRHYGRFLAQAVDSVLRQLLDSWELILIDDASQDETAEICESFAAHYSDRIRVVRNDTPAGLAVNANRAIEMARGRYVMRLDADDWLDEAALLVLSRYLDEHRDVALVYPNYFYVDAAGRTLEVENRKRLGSEDRLLDLPAHGACTMVRRRVMRVIGGYDETLDAQDGYDLWLKIRHRYRVGNIETPLFYYRQHATSVSHDSARILNARQDIQRAFREKNQGPVRVRSVAVVPAKNTYSHMKNVVLGKVAGRPLIDWTLEAALRCELIDAVVVTTDDEAVAGYASEYHERVYGLLRPAGLSEADRRLSEVLYDAVERLEMRLDLHPDVVVMLSTHSPLRVANDIEQAVATLMMFDADSVISVYSDHDLHFVHGEHGLESLNPAMEKRLRLEREGLYVHNGATVACWRDIITPERYYGTKIAHVEMAWENSFQIKSDFSRWLVEQILRRREADRASATTPISGTSAEQATSSC